MPPFKDEHVLIIAPGSQTTQAQLGLPETFTPPRWRFPTRMFAGLNQGEWEPVKIRTTVKTKVVSNGTADAETTTEQPSTTDPKPDPTPADTEMGEASNEANGEPVTEQPPIPTPDPTSLPADAEPTSTTEETYEDDPFSTEDAVYPMRSGRIENWPCFFALLSHIYKFISPPFHMPVLVIAQPCWTARDKEWITQYFFENWRIPALCVMDSALAAAYAYGVQSCCVVDVGLDKADVSAVSEFMVNEIGRGVSVEDCGGNAMTRRLQDVLSQSGKYGQITWEIAEQLKRSPICEILPAGVPMPVASENQPTNVPNPAAAASTGAIESGANAKDIDGAKPGQAPRGPGAGTEVGEERGDEEDDNEGVLDVAAIVARDNAAEVVAKREREKAEKAAAKKGGQVEAPKPVRLRNADKATATFNYEEYLAPDVANGGSRKRRREVEVGLERFMPATPSADESDGVLDKLAAAVHSTILSVPDISARAALWDNLIVLGNGSRVRGFTSALIAALGSRYTLSPSTATMFTSELPSNFTTPVPTNGTNTPIPGQQHSMHHPAGHGVNPLLVAATKNMMQPSGHHLQVPGQAGSATPMSSIDANSHQSYRGFTQTPTSMKTVKAPEYFPEWKDPSVSGMEDAVFLGAQVAAKVVFIVDQGVSKGFLTRTEYNDLGPEGIHSCAM